MRLPNGYGSVIKNTGSRRKPFQARITKDYDDEGKQIYETIGFFEKREEALRALAEYHNRPYDIGSSKLTFVELYRRWSKDYYSKIGDSAVTNYKNAYRYCEPLYNIRFADIRTPQMQKIIDESGVGYATRKVIKTFLGLLYKYAFQNDIVDKKYSEFTNIGKNEAKINRKPFSEKEIDNLFKHVDKLEFVDTVLIMIYTGLRISELLSIETTNVHIEDRYMVGGMKTDAGKDRIIPINKKIEPLINKYFNLQNKYLIVNYKGEQMKYSNYRREKFDNIMEKLNMKHTPHDCRHTFASIMDSVNANKLCIKRIIGHASSDITDKVYTHKTIKELIEAIDLI